MADVRPGEGGRGVRAQLLIVGAILIGVLLVGLAIVLNSAIFAENLATRQSDAASSDIGTFRSGALTGVGDAIDSTNQVGAGDSFTQLRDNRYRPRVTDLSDQLGSHRALSGASVSVSPVDSRPGTQIVDGDPSTDLVPRGGTPVDWTMATESHVRAFELTADPDDGSSLGNALTGGSGDALVVTLAPGSGPAHEVAVYHDGGARVAVSEVGSSTVRECNADGAIVNLSLTGHPTVDGTYCGALSSVAAADGTYDVSVTNGDRATGTYRLVVDRTDGTPATASLDEQVDRANYGTACPSTPTYYDSATDSPYSLPAIYASTVELNYEDSRAASKATVRVTPAQAGDRLTTPLVASLSVTDNSANGDTSLVVDWTVEDPNGNLDAVTVTVDDRGDGDDLSNTIEVSGASATDSLTYTDAGDAGDEYDITVSVTDGSDSRSRTVRHTADGDEGCLP